MTTKTSQSDIANLAGKAAFFIRGVGQYIIERADKGHDKAFLRKAQDAGLAEVQQRGETISVPYISQLTGKLEKAGVFTKQRHGKSYTIHWTEDSLTFLDELVASDFGTENTPQELSVVDLKHRSSLIRHLESHEGVVIDSTRPVPKAGYKLLWDRFNRGELVMGFFTPEQAAMLTEDYPEYP